MAGEGDGGSADGRARDVATADDVERPVHLVGRLPGGALSFRVARPMTARDALVALGLSRPVIARAFGARALRAGADDAGGEALHERAPLAAGDVFSLTPQVTHHAGPTSDAPVTVLYEDWFVLAAEKPQGLLVHGDGSDAETLTACVQGHLARQCAPGAAPVAQALQRLDVQTSGIVLFSKLEEFQPLFDRLIAGADGARARKTYLALVAGAFPAGRLTLRDPIGRDRHDARRMRVSATGQAALTEVTRLGVFAPDGRGGLEPCLSADDASRGRAPAPALGRYSLLEVTLGTGRRHQIRVHLAAHGFPIVNDPLYGRLDRGPLASAGLMLHAWRESFVHPVTGEVVSIQTTWPQRFPRWDG